MKNVDVFVFHGYDCGNGDVLIEIELIIEVSVGVSYKDNKGGVKNFVDVEIVYVEESDEGEEMHEESSDNINVEENTVLDNNVDDRDNDDNYLDNNVDTYMVEASLQLSDERLLMEGKKG